MSNELSFLTEFTRNLFKHAFFLLPWFARNFQERTFEAEDFRTTLPFLKRIKKEKPQLFGPRQEMCEANKSLVPFLINSGPKGTLRQTRKPSSITWMPGETRGSTEKAFS